VGLRHTDCKSLSGAVSRTELVCLPKGCAAGVAVDFCWVRRGEAWHSKTPREMTKSIHAGGRPVWAEISLKAILRNLEIIRKHVNPGGRAGREFASEVGGGFLANEMRTGKSACATEGEGQNRRPEASGTKGEKQNGRMILAVVKSNAYGLGAVPISKALQKAGTDWFGVTCANEGIELRESGIRKRILVLTGFWPGEEKRLLENYLTPTVTRVDDLRHLERAAKAFLGKSARGKSARGKSLRVPFHLKINTGMNRLGISPPDVEAFASALAECSHIKLEGTFTHFASAEDFIGGQTVTQEELFRSCLERLRALGVAPGIVHLANSGAICARPETWADMVRPGAILYGYHQRFDPPEKRSEVMAEMPLEPCLSLRARIISLREVPPGEAVGYSARFVTERPSKIGVINAGYADGVVRARTNRGCTLVRERRVPLVGTISMDLTTLDVTDVPGVALGDVVTIYGKDGKSAIEVSDVAPEIGTVTSDLLCALGRRVPKYYV
jgi:alanine racemase